MSCLQVIAVFESTGSVAEMDFYYTANEPHTALPDSFWAKGVNRDGGQEDLGEFEIVLVGKNEDIILDEEGEEEVVVEIMEQVQSEDEEPEAVYVEVNDQRHGAVDEEVEVEEKPAITRRKGGKRKPALDDKEPTCVECQQVFSSDQELKEHKLTHKNKNWICEICGKISTQKRIYKAHLLVHSNEKPYECSDCPMRFVRLQGLKRHRLTHTGEKPYACHHCGQRFAAFMSHQMHVRLHTGERPYQCKHCGEDFIGLPSLNVSFFLAFAIK